MDGALQDRIQDRRSIRASVSTGGGRGFSKDLAELGEIFVVDFSSLIGGEVPAHFAASVGGDLSALKRIAIGSGRGSIATIASQSSGIGAGGWGGALEYSLSPLFCVFFTLDSIVGLLDLHCCVQVRGRGAVAVGHLRRLLWGCGFLS